ncbi:hypothetical protein V8C35DRAFT_206250 [Trichoderma chlorosporum]
MKTQLQHNPTTPQDDDRGTMASEQFGLWDREKSSKRQSEMPKPLRGSKASEVATKCVDPRSYQETFFPLLASEAWRYFPHNAVHQSGSEPTLCSILLSHSPRHASLHSTPLFKP